MIEKYVDAAVAAKGGDADRATLEMSLTSILSTPFKAVAVDIDGTVTASGSIELDTASRQMLLDLVSGGVPLALVTGRGRQGARAFARELADALKEAGAPSADRVWVYCHHGGFRAQLSQLAADDGFAGWTELFPDKRMAEHEYDTLAHHAPGGFTREPFSVRVVGDRPSASFDASAQALGLRGIEGTYGGQPVFEYLRLSKADAIKDFAGVAGVAEQLTVSIGDMGHEAGADFELLDRPAGFTTDSASYSLVGCFPVPGDDGVQLRGAAAAVRLLQDLRFLPPLSRLVAADDGQTLGVFHAFQREARRTSAGVWTQADSWLRELELRLYGVSEPTPLIPDIYDRRSGGVWLRDEEVGLAGDGFAGLSEFFQLQNMAITPAADAGTRARAWFTDSGILLRGDEHYPLSRYAEPAGLLLDETSEGLVQLAAAVDRLCQPENRTELKLVFAALDYARHKAIVGLTLGVSTASRQDGEVSAAPAFVASAWGHVVESSRLFHGIVTDPNFEWEQWRGRLRALAEDVARLLSSRAEQIAPHELTVKDVFRWREADWPLESMLAMKNAVEATVQVLDGAKEINTVGLAYGGLELPAVAVPFLEDAGLRVRSFAARVSLYGEMAAGDRIRRRDDDYFDTVRSCLPFIGLDGASSFGDKVATLVLDDNATTGLSLEVARDLIAVTGGNPVRAGIVRYPGPGRWHQMCMQDHGALDPFWYFRWVFGLVSVSPYTRTTRHHPAHTKYEDELGNFDKAKARIERLNTKNKPIDWVQGVQSRPDSSILRNV